MRRLLAATMLAALSMAAVAQPTKWPIIDSADAKMPLFFRDSQNFGVGLGWWWFDGLRWRIAGGVITYEQMQATWNHTRYHELMGTELAAWWAAEDKRAKAVEIWNRYVTGTSCFETTDTKQKSLCTDFREYMLTHKPQDPLFSVASNREFLTRPAYPFVNGVRGSQSNGRAIVGAPCDCVLAGVAEGKSVYCSVNSRPNQVALCTRVQN